ncbi:hypothetical protein DRQ25_04530 [Candidatus Fermentibacteria bacterium]|nr:MAG: hypothetical protein DRQ25_04530 [Candidatus Fermentibacteria bacterium]
MRFIIAFSVCFVSVAGAVDNGFPDDPAGVEIIDRAFCNDFSFPYGVLLYLRLFNEEDRGTVELFSGTPNGQVYTWELIYSWQPELYGGTPYTFLPVSVISLQSCGSTLLVTWLGVLFTEYHEGIGSFYLEYNFETGETDEFWSD